MSTNSNQPEIKVDVGSDSYCLDSTKINYMAPPPRLRRNWEVFHGNNNFYCDGRIMMASQPRVFFVTFALILVVALLYAVNEFYYLAVNVSIFVPVIGILQFTFVLLVLARTAMMDPGIIPLPTKDEIDKTLDVMGIKDYDKDYIHPPFIKEIDINGVKVNIKFCYTCKVFRPPRASHCSVCNVCIDRFDHHCPWVGNCIGKRNYRYFYMFLVSLAITSVYIFACIVIHITLLMKTSNFIDTVKTTPLSFVEGGIIFFSIWSVIGLASFHTYLLVTNQTTNEDIKSSFTSIRSMTNPYSEGGVIANACYLLCGNTFPSLIDRRGFVEEHTLPTVVTQQSPQTEIKDSSVNNIVAVAETSSSIADRTLEVVTLA